MLVCFSEFDRLYAGNQRITICLVSQK